MTTPLSFTTSEGREVQLRRVARRHVERVRAKYVLPGVPTYTFTVAGGDEVTRPHDESTVKEGTPEERANWAEYEGECSRILMEQNTATAKFLIYNCVAEEPPPIEEWNFDFTLWDVEPPDDSDPIAFKVEWFESEILIDPEDYAQLMSKLYELGDLMDSKKAREFESFFRLTMARLAAGGGTG